MSFFLNTSDCQRLERKDFNVFTVQQHLELWQTYVLFLGLAVVTIVLAKLFNVMSSKIRKETDNVDSDFDAGGKVSVGLTASTIVSQWTWVATLLTSSAVASKYGISGPFWYAAGASIQILLFAMLSVQLKIKAPGAKTFLQVIKARFGSKPHIVFCVFALITNAIVTAMLMLGGAAVMSSLVKELNIELSTFLVAAIIGPYTYIGGLGATFYVSYVNAAVIFIIMFIFLNKIYNDSSSSDNATGSINAVYSYISCVRAPDGNYESSHLTMISQPGLMFGIINIVGNFGSVFVDQSYWQSSVAAKPKEGVFGFLIGGLVWFSVPFTFATTMGLAYTALSAKEGAPLLSESDVDAGLVAPIVAQKVLGRSGEFLILIMMLMAVTSTGSAEIIAVTSILIYDIYQIYLRPYRLVHDSNSCILCGKSRGRMANSGDKCVCTSMTFCLSCVQDNHDRLPFKNRPIKPRYQCKTHSQFREYNDYLKALKNWCILWTSVSVVPLTILLHLINVSLSWTYLFMGILIGSAVIPISLCMFWTRLTGMAMVCGSVSGTVCGIVVWLCTAHFTQQGGLANFFASTGAETSMLSGNLTAFLTSGVVTIVMSLIETRDGVKNVTEIWECTRNIDNPLQPWTEHYARDLKLYGAEKLDNRPGLEEVERTFRPAKLLAIIGSLSLSVILIVLWPAITVAAGVFQLSGFTAWVVISAVWAGLGGLVMIILPIASEIWEVVHTLKNKKSIVIPQN